MSDFIAEKTTYWIAHGDGILSYGVADAGNHVASGQPFLETFEKYLPFRARVLELGGEFT